MSGASGKAAVSCRAARSLQESMNAVEWRPFHPER